jgi:hypothetical protein
MRVPQAVCVAGALLASCATGTTTAAPTSSHTVKWIDLSRDTVTVVDCATAHLAEVYLRAPMAVDKAVDIVANKDCNAGFAPYTGRSVDGSPFSITFLIDSKQDRTGADPTPSTVICLLLSANGQSLTGSARR